MKIMHICQMTGGVSVYVRNTIQAADGRLDFVIVHGKRDKCRPVYSGVKAVPEITVELTEEFNILRDIRALIQTVNAIKRERPDVIHCHAFKGGLIGRIAGWLTGTRTFFTPHAFSFLKGKNTHQRRFFKIIERLTKFDARLLACSGSEQVLAKNYVKYPHYRCMVWHNSAPEPVIDPEETTLPIPKRPFILFIGRPSAQKNPLLFVEVAQKIRNQKPDSYFIMLGLGIRSASFKRVQKAIEEKGLVKSVKILNWADHDDALNYLRNSLFYVSVSRYEGLSFSIVEAMSLGKPVVATNVPGNNDCVKDGVTGFLADDADSLAAASIRLLEDEELRRKMGQAGHDFYESSFNIHKRIGLLEDIYKR